MHDADRFLLKYRDILNRAPLQLYSSALVFAPATSIVRKTFKEHLPSWLKRYPKVRKSWDSTIRTLEGHSDRIEKLAISPSGKTLASASHDNNIRLWDIDSGNVDQVLKIESHSLEECSLAFSPDGKSLALGFDDGTITLLDMITGDERVLKGHSESITSIVFMPEGKLLVSGHHLNGSLRLWDINTGQLREVIKFCSHADYQILLSPNGILFALAVNRKPIRLFDLTNGSIRQISACSSRYCHIAVSPDTRKLALVSAWSIVQLWDIMTDSLEQTFQGKLSWPSPIAFSHDSKLLAIGYSNTIRLWDIATGNLQQVFEGHTGTVSSMVVSFNNRWLISSSHDKTIRFWDITANDQPNKLQGNRDPVRTVLFSPNGRLLASVSRNGAIIQLWSIAVGNLHHNLEGHGTAVSSVAFSHDSKLLASTSDTGTINFWDTVTGCIRESHVFLRVCCAIAISTDNMLFANGTFYNTIELRDVSTGSVQQSFDFDTRMPDDKVRSFPAECVTSLAFSHDNKLLASGCSGKTLRVWGVQNSDLQQTINVDGIVRKLRFQIDRPYLVTEIGMIRYRQSPTDDLSSLSPPRTQLRLTDVCDWILCDEEPLIWLPPEYRSKDEVRCGDELWSRTWDSMDEVLAIGCASGEVVFFEIEVLRVKS